MTRPEVDTSSVTERARNLGHGLMDDELGPYIPGVNCIDCGRFVGRDGHIGIEHFEMSSEISSVDGQCRRCIDAAFDREVDAERRHLTDLVT